jgi:hypothetical protein
MNDADESLPDELLGELLKPLRETTAPAEAEIANRLAVQTALAKQVRPTWWQRSIAVPIPIAIAATIALIVTVAALLRPLPTQPIATIKSRGRTDISTAVERAKEAQAVNEPVRPAWRITQSYIRTFLSPAGAAGFVKPNAKENRNDS